MKGLKTLAVLLVCPFALFAQETAQEWVAKGDSADAIYQDADALGFYEKAIALDSTSCEALWKASRSHVNIGEVGGEDAQDIHYPAAEKKARRAAELCPNDADTQLSLAIAVGRLAIMRGGKTKVELSKEVKESAEKAIELDPSKDIAYHVLARWNREVASLSGLKKALAKVIYGGLPPASKEKAVELFQKAIELNPAYINHHYELGLTFESLDQWTDAKVAYEKVAALEPKQPRDKKYQAEAAQHMQKVMKKL
ncbi:hypothetical protein JW992_02660 [candidate division KSB1 bacterium]|nr:hypothetical protein [candidate division KSB1 bacterium]